MFQISKSTLPSQLATLLRVARDVRQKIESSKGKSEGNSKYLDSAVGHHVSASLAAKLKKYCLSRFSKKFLENNIKSLDDIFALNTIQIQKLESKIVPSAAVLKHQKFVQFIQDTTKCTDYQSVYQNSKKENHDHVSNPEISRVSTSCIKTISNQTPIDTNVNSIDNEVSGNVEEKIDTTLKKKSDLILKRTNEKQ